MTTAELFAYDKGFAGLVAGVDEAGRGPLAGPVVCACCVMGDTYIEGINDSKKLSEKKREALYEKIVASALAYGVGIVDEKTIDEINILNATKKGMQIAANSLKVTPDIVLIDAVKGLELPYRQQAIIKGDATSYAIAAASIIAKVTRDRLMRAAGENFPEYGFAKNKGYGTAEHIAALKKFGPCELHRRTFVGNFTDVRS
ncbi:MAG TPA: ribonuclease HII [Firmicutes bacterium]|nr:ribonuclease HII [Bacillota bacterium]